MKILERDDTGWRLFPGRRYDPQDVEESNDWLFWKWFDITAQGDATKVYLRRLYLLRTPWFSVMLHRILRPDPDRDLHDHPWDFIALVLRGKYQEQRGRRIFTRRWWNFCRAEGAHRIVYVTPDCTTLVITGRKRRSWGFHTPTGWIHWRTYVFGDPR